MSTSPPDIGYVPWGFKLNCMNARIPPRFYRNLHNFDEYNTPRVDIGMLTGALFERPVYDFGAQLPKVAEEFYLARKGDIEQLTKSVLMAVGALQSPSGLLFLQESDDFRFVPPGRDVDAGKWTVGKPYALFVYYGGGDSVGTAEHKGFPFFRVITATLTPSGQGKCRWDYHEIQVGRGSPQNMNRRFLAGPLFVAYFGDAYTDLGFDDQSPESQDVYLGHTSYFTSHASLKEPFEQLINRETIIGPNEYGEVMVLWDGEPAHRSLVASQPYYECDDDLQSAQVDYRLVDRIAVLEEQVRRLKEERPGSTR